MGKLNIAHHKSYHPYRRDNIERVRRDEEEARQKEAAEEGRLMLADSEARMDLLRRRAGLQGSNRRTGRTADRDDADLERLLEERDRDDGRDAGPSTLTSASGHINLFEDLERETLTTMSVRSTRNTKAPSKESENEKGIALAPSAQDQNPWYSDRDHEKNRETDGDKRIRDLARKSVHDPLTSINSQLAARTNSSPASSSSSSFTLRACGSRALPLLHTTNRPPAAVAAVAPPAPVSASAERQSRESSERQRALELIRRKKRDTEGSETPSTVRGGGGNEDRYGSGYRDVFNRREVEEVHMARRRGADRYQDRDRDRDGKLEHDRYEERYGDGSSSRRW